MAKLTFNQYQDDFIGVVQTLEQVKDRLNNIKDRHVLLGFGSLQSTDFDGTNFTQAEYNAAVAELNDFLTNWWPTHAPALLEILIQSP